MGFNLNFFAFAVISHLLPAFYAQKPGWLDQENEDQEPELDRRGKGREHGNALADFLDNAEQDSSQHRAGNGADPPDDRGGKRLDPRERARRGRDGGNLHQIETPRHRRERRADDKGERDQGVRVDAHQLRGAAVFGEREHRPPG